ncbi:MAG: hypothetical protein DRO87_02685 [Candidatus Thorarchaeota archaeon]|nr:MAG: hypothetical protein DRO87_02685 [Candidatus Thorarchaeota archaeon]
MCGPFQALPTHIRRMRITERERTEHSRFREVSQLRAMFQCEYRYVLDQRVGESGSWASVYGEQLHRRVASVATRDDQSTFRLVPFLVAALALLLGAIWILW